MSGIMQTKPVADPRGMKRFRMLRAPRGQALIEYTIVAHALLLAVGLFAWPFLVYLMNALSLYFKGIYFVVSSPVP